MPAALQGIVSKETFEKSAEYTLAKSRFGQWEDAWETLVLLTILCSGLLPRSAEWFGVSSTGSVSMQAAWFFVAGLSLSLPSLPFEWWGQFRLEERFGFNTTRQGTWWFDRLKGFTLAAVLGVPMILLLLKLAGWMGATWWLWAWLALFAFQLLVVVMAPYVIMPLFNKFSLLPEGPLRDRLLKLGERTGFTARTIQVMDGSKRSRHSNAFFTGFGRLRKIDLFVTLVEQLSPTELEGVLAHEIGHFKLRHIPQRLAWAAASSFAMFAAIGWLAGQAWFPAAFGFTPAAGLAPVLLIFGLLAGSFTFWTSPLGNLWSRRHEYQADAFAREAVGSPEPLVSALRKLSEKNLSNLTPHPWYSFFHYSHPTLLEREAALRGA